MFGPRALTEERAGNVSHSPVVGRIREGYYPVLPLLPCTGGRRVIPRAVSVLRTESLRGPRHDVNDITCSSTSGHSFCICNRYSAKTRCVFHAQIGRNNSPERHPRWRLRHNRRNSERGSLGPLGAPMRLRAHRIGWSGFRTRCYLLYTHYLFCLTCTYVKGGV